MHLTPEKAFELCDKLHFFWKTSAPSLNTIQTTLLEYLGINTYKKICVAHKELVANRRGQGFEIDDASILKESFTGNPSAMESLTFDGYITDSCSIKEFTIIIQGTIF